MTEEEHEEFQKMFEQIDRLEAIGKVQRQRTVAAVERHRQLTNRIAARYGYPPIPREETPLSWID